jgi:hypothetical protein
VTGHSVAHRLPMKTSANRPPPEKTRELAHVVEELSVEVGAPERIGLISQPPTIKWSFSDMPPRGVNLRSSE